MRPVRRLTPETLCICARSWVTCSCRCCFTRILSVRPGILILTMWQTLPAKSSFTGIRIGVSTAKGLAWGAQKPAIGVSTLEAMAYHGIAAGEGALVCTAMDARRSQIYNALFEIRDGKPRRLCQDRAISLAELGAELKKMQKSVFLVGDGAQLCYNTCLDMGIPAVLAPGNLVVQSAWGVAMAAFGQTPAPAEELLPVYLRLSQAERERQARLAAEAEKD